MNIEFTTEQLVASYRNGNDEFRKAIKKALGEDFSKELPIQERIKTFEDAINELGHDHPAVRSYNSVRYGSASNEPDIMAYLKLRIITAALNDGWEPQFTEGEYRWYCWFELLTKSEVDEMSDEEKAERRVVGRANYSAYASGGLVYAVAYYVSANSYTHVGSRLAFKSEELADYAGKQFAETYADYCFLPEKSKAE